MQFSEAADDDVSYRFGLVVERLVRWLRSASSKGSGAVSSSTATALGRLQQEGPMRITELAQVEGISQPAMTQLVDRIVKAGLARRTTSGDDRRCVLVEITQAGVDTVDERRRRRSGHLHALLQDLADDERAAIVAALPALERLSDSAMATPATSVTAN
ncbi:MarR family winged helix-turn-helix transcriptional regulator [Spelaeicoccus albus]|uniref:DNA-binding MarR family transcriptional regulator n=1 Tax=Spelaeicoccus albus TaxID=1280376 RepID=A0A7Z0ABI3_9MICO|nr:MarR family transcriptional regulator [Spelaeicoccus albus]NYI67158.1 DNA-binding MarR family transcriptional regulator [Spelaeicoccus albus]